MPSFLQFTKQIAIKIIIKKDEEFPPNLRIYVDFC